MHVWDRPCEYMKILHGTTEVVDVGSLQNSENTDWVTMAFREPPYNAVFQSASSLRRENMNDLAYSMFRHVLALRAYP